MKRHHLDRIVVGGGSPSNDKGYGFINCSPPGAARRSGFQILVRLCTVCPSPLRLNTNEARRQLSARAEIEKQSAAIPGAKGKSSLKGKKVPPKHRSPSGETWGGQRPRWMVEALKKGKNMAKLSASTLCPSLSC